MSAADRSAAHRLAAKGSLDEANALLKQARAPTTRNGLILKALALGLDALDAEDAAGGR